MGLNSVKLPQIIRLGDDLELDAGAYELRRGDRRLKLERIPMELLLLLVEQHGQLVSREQIVERIWGKDVYLATDSSINAAMRKLRQALKDDSDEPRFVQTISGKGYRFIAPVAEVEGPVEAIPAPSQIPTAEVLSNPSPGKHGTGIRSGPLLAACVLLIAGVLGGYLVWSRSRVQPAVASGRKMLAVLPFENLTGDPAQEYFSDGLTEEMITQLGNVDPQQLGVIARTSVMYYKSRREQLPQVASELGVQYVLEGSVRRDSGKVRITAQLIQMKDQSHIWARQYDRELSNLLTVQDEIAHEITSEIQRTLGEGPRREAVLERPLSERQYEAYDLYLKGQYSWNKRTSTALWQAVDYFQQAIGKDPNYARAYAGLADSYALLCGYNSSVEPQVAMKKARAAALRAIELDEKSPEAHTALAVVAQNYDWDWQMAEREYRRAIQLNPNYATAHHWYGEFLGLQGRFDESFRELEYAKRLDPLSLIIAADHGAVLYYARQNDRSIAQFHAVLEMEPNFPRAYNIVAPYAEKGMFKDALAQIESMDKASRDNSWPLAWQAYLYGRSGERARALQSLEQLKRLNKTAHLDPAPMILAYIGVDDKPQALFWLDQAYAEHSSAITSLKVSPLFDPLRQEPHFQELLRKMGFAS